jgi:CDP-diacylglycerol--serine O-phosphatidyltransferase
MDFKLKDVCTVANILMALYAVVLCFEARLEVAAWVIFAAWFTDGLDGLIARWTKTGNEFGVNFDNQADLFIYTVAPAFYVYAVYRDYSQILGTAVCFAVITVGCIRLSRFNVRPLIYPGFWIGYPRSALGLHIVILYSSNLFRYFTPYGGAAVLTLILATLNLSYIPYRNHKAQLTTCERWVCRGALATGAVAYPFGYFWDVSLIWSTIYLLLPFTPLYASYKAPINSYIQEWKARAR